MNKYCKNNTKYVHVNLGKGKALPQKVMKVEKSGGMLGFHPYFDIRHNQEAKAVSSASRPRFTRKEILSTRFWKKKKKRLSGSHG